MSWHGVRTVAGLELRQRLRTSRWPVVLGVWAGVIALVSLLSHRAMNDPELQSGPAMYDVVIFFVLGLGMLVVPSLTATSVNGDREHGVLATLQVTLLTPWDLVLGKLLAAWAVAAAFLGAAMPFLAWAWAEGGLSFGRILVSLLVLMLVLAVVCAVGLMFSTLTARTISSAVLTYLAMGALVFGTVIGFSLSIVLVSEDERVRVHGVPDEWWQENELREGQDGAGDGVTFKHEPTRADCTTFTREMTVAHTERIWWLLPLNPFVVVADAAPPAPPTGRHGIVTGFTPMRSISAGARTARVGETGEVRQECHFGGPGAQAYTPEDPLTRAASAAPVWPYGLGFLLAAGAASTWVASRRLRTPVHRLPSGTRIA